jgi:hypothetical protein
MICEVCLLSTSSPGVLASALTAISHNLQVMSTPSSVTICWEPPERENGFPVVGYEIQRAGKAPAETQCRKLDMMSVRVGVLHIRGSCAS